jgi:hypothetical protein
VVKQFKLDFKETKTEHVSIKLSELFYVYLENMPPEKKSQKLEYQTLQIFDPIIDISN